MNYRTAKSPHYEIELRWRDVSGPRLIAFGLWSDLMEILGLHGLLSMGEPKCRSGVRVFRTSDGLYLRGWGFDYRSDAERRFGRLEYMASNLDPDDFEDALRNAF